MPEPADHHMTMLTDVDIGSGSLRFAKDYVGVDYHNDGHSHIDAFSHVAFDGSLFDGKPAASVTAEGAQAGAIEVLKDGLVGRGVLLDVPRVRGRPVDRAGRPRLPRGPRGGGARAGRDGRGRRHPSRPHGPRAPPGRARAVGHPRGEGGPAPHRGIVPGGPADRRARLGRQQRHGSEHHGRGRRSRFTSSRSTPWASTCSTTSSSRTSRAHCEAAGRWEFLFAAAPLRIVGGTGSPINPIAIF